MLLKCSCMKNKSSKPIARDNSFFKSSNSSFEKFTKPVKSFKGFISESTEKLKAFISLTLDSMGLIKYFSTFFNSLSSSLLSKTIIFPHLTFTSASSSNKEIHCILLSALWSYCAGNVS